MTRVFQILIEEGEGVAPSNRGDRFPEELRTRFLESRWYAFHEALFELSERFPNVWIDGNNLIRRVSFGNETVSAGSFTAVTDFGGFGESVEIVKPIA